MNTYTHERLLQLLSAMLVHLNTLQAHIGQEPGETSSDGDALRNGLNVLEHMTRDVLSIVRSTTDEQPLAELEGVTLADALTRMVEEKAERLALSSRMSFSGVDEQTQAEKQTLSAEAERILYIIAREALFQVQQHAGARKLRLVLNYGREDVQMSFEDDGANPIVDTSEESSYDIPTPPFAVVSSLVDTASTVQGTTLIMHDLRTRISQLGGSLEVEPLVERGTRWLACVPYTLPLGWPDSNIGSIAHIEAPVVAAQQVSILIVDNQAVTRAGLHYLLETYPGLRIVGEAADGIQAVSETLELGPRVVLMDAMLPHGQSLQALRQIKQLNLDTKVLLLSTQDREEYLYETLRAGADGYVLKDIAPDELVQALYAVARGELLVQPQLAGKLLSRFGRDGHPGYDTLTARELEVLRLLARGLRNKEIAARLTVSERTVNFHLANIYQKLHVSGRTEALSKALEQGLIMA